METVGFGVKDRAIPINLIVALLFILLNPLYAISICAILNLVDARINFRFFGFMFVCSFALSFFLCDWGAGEDVIYVLRKYQMAGTHPLSDIFSEFIQKPQGSEPLYYTFVWLFRRLFGYHPAVFVMFNYFLIFSLAALLGQAVHKERFVVVICCLLFVSLGFLYNTLEVWRHTTSVLLFFIGIFLFERNEKKLLSRVLMYCSGFIHLVSIPLIILYELYVLCLRKISQLQMTNRSQRIRRYGLGVIIFGICSLTVFVFSDRYGSAMSTYLNLSSVFKSNLYTERYGLNFVINWVLIATIFYFWINRKQLMPNDLFIGVNYFLMIFVLLNLDLPSHAIGRIWYAFQIGVSILYAKLLLKDLKLGLIGLSGLLVYRFYTFARMGEVKGLSLILGGGLLDPLRGLLWMVANYASLYINTSDVL